jgi:hypothetical protein
VPNDLEAWGKNLQLAMTLLPIGMGLLVLVGVAAQVFDQSAIGNLR